MDRNLNKVLNEYGKKFRVPRRKWPVKSFICKDRCYGKRPTTIAELKAKISRIFEEFDLQILKLVLRDFLTRLEQVIEKEGGHIETVLK